MGNYFEGPNAVFEIGLNPFQITVYLYLCQCRYDGELSFPSLRSIEKKCGMSRPKVIETLKELESMRLISKTKRVKGNVNMSNSYTLHTPIKSEEHT